MNIQPFDTAGGHHVSQIHVDKTQGLITAQVTLKESGKVQTITIRNAKFDEMNALAHLEKRVDEAALMQLRYGSGGTKQIIWKPEQGTVERVFEHARPAKAWKNEPGGKDTKTHNVKDDLAIIDNKIIKNAKERNKEIETRNDLYKIMNAKTKEVQTDKAWLDNYERTKNDLQAPLPPELKALKPTERLQYIDGKRNDVLRKEAEIEKLQKTYDDAAVRIQKLNQRISALKTYAQAMEHVKPPPAFITPPPTFTSSPTPAMGLPLAEPAPAPGPGRRASISEGESVAQPPGEQKTKRSASVGSQSPIAKPLPTPPKVTPKAAEKERAELEKNAEELKDKTPTMRPGAHRRAATPPPPSKEESLLRKPLPPVPPRPTTPKAAQPAEATPLAAEPPPTPPLSTGAPTEAVTPDPSVQPMAPPANPLEERMKGVTPKVTPQRKDRAETQ